MSLIRINCDKCNKRMLVSDSKLTKDDTKRSDLNYFCSRKKCKNET